MHTTRSVLLHTCRKEQGKQNFTTALLPQSRSSQISKVIYIYPLASLRSQYVQYFPSCSAFFESSIEGSRFPSFSSISDEDIHTTHTDQYKQESGILQYRKMAPIRRARTFHKKHTTKKSSMTNAKQEDDNQTPDIYAHAETSEQTSICDRKPRVTN